MADNSNFSSAGADSYWFPDDSRPPANNESSILTGADSISATVSPEPNEDRNSNEVPISTVKPYLHTPFGFDNANDYFSYRNDLVESSIKECISTLIFPSEDGTVVGSWLLTEISLWDHEKERIVILTKKAVMVIKYDFIALKKIEFRRIPLSSIDTIVTGDLIYPKSSLVPRLNGISDGITTVVRECVLDRFSHSSKSATRTKENISSAETNFKLGPINMKYFESRERNMSGIRLMWNRGQPLNFLKKWNPFDKTIPFNTFTFHPLYYHKDDERSCDLYDVEHFGRNVINTIEELQNDETTCVIHHAPIVLQCYVGLTSLVHNKTSLGFFKVRGKFSF